MWQGNLVRHLENVMLAMDLEQQQCFCRKAC